MKTLILCSVLLLSSNYASAAGEALLQNGTITEARETFQSELTGVGCENVQLTRCRTVRANTINFSDGGSTSGSVVLCNVASSNCNIECSAYSNAEYDSIRLGGSSGNSYYAHDFGMTGERGDVLIDNAAPGTGSYVCKKK